MANWYVDSVAYTAVAQWAANTAYVLGNIIRQKATPSVGSERCFRCTTAGTSAATTEPTWTLTHNGTTADGTGSLVWTECTGQETYQGVNWAAPFARVQTTMASGFSAAGDTIFIGSDHAETQSGNMGMTSPGTFSNPSRFICVSRPSSNIPPAATDVTTGGTINSTAASSNSAVSWAGSFYAYGITIANSAAGGYTFNTSTNGYQIFDTCKFTQTSLSGSGPITLGSTNEITEFRNVVYTTTLNSGQPNSGIVLQSGSLKWLGGSLVVTYNNANVPVIFQPTIGGVGLAIEVHGVDFSSLVNTHPLVLSQSTASTGSVAQIDIINCKLPSSYAVGTVKSGAIVAQNIGNIDMITTDSSGQGAREEHYRYQGSIVSDVANYRNGGATDGTTPKSWKLVSLSNAAYINPLYAPDIYQWLPSPGSYTLTVYVANTSSLTLTDQQFGFDYMFMGTSGNPLATFSTTLSNPLATGTNLTADSTSTWTGLVSPTRQSVSATFTTTEAGFVRVRLKLCKATTTMWVDPLVIGG